MSFPSIPIAILPLPGMNVLDLPAYMTPGAAGADIYAAVHDPVVLQPGERVLIPTGFAVAIPEGYEAQIRPRSGLSLKEGLTAIIGTVDSDFRGGVGVIMMNVSNQPKQILQGDRIAQMVIAPVVQGDFQLVDELPETTRGTGGFGSTGHRAVP